MRDGDLVMLVGRGRGWSLHGFVRAHAAGVSRTWARFHGQDGQVFVLAAISMVALCAVAGFAIDVGVWYQAHRKQQAIADSAALVAAGDLPASTSLATTDANAYAAKNGGSASSISFSTQYLPNDTITVQAQNTVPAYFLKVIGIDSTTVKALAVARAENLSSAWGSAPFGVINTQPELASKSWGAQTTLDLNIIGPGGFGIINIDGSSGGTSPGTLASWIVNGCDCSTATPVWLNSDPGAKFNSSQVKGAMDQIIGHTLLFPVYDTTQGNGANLQYHVIGFAGFNITDYTFKGNSGTITGSFVQTDWQGTGTTDTTTYYGATTTQLVG
jgi:Flp pilus assembly protein TadG